jgi:hypothetical protein
MFCFFLFYSRSARPALPPVAPAIAKFGYKNTEHIVSGK